MDDVRCLTCLSVHSSARNIRCRSTSTRLEPSYRLPGNVHLQRSRPDPRFRPAFSRSPFQTQIVHRSERCRLPPTPNRVPPRLVPISSHRKEILPSFCPIKSSRPPSSRFSVVEICANDCTFATVPRAGLKSICDAPIEFGHLGLA